MTETIAPKEDSGDEKASRLPKEKVLIGLVNDNASAR